MSFLRANVTVALGTLLSRLTGLVRVLVLAKVLSRAVADAYNLGNNTPNVVYELLLGGVLTAALVPLFTGLLDDEDDHAVSAVVTVASIALFGLTVVAVLAAPVVVAVYTSLQQGEAAAAFQDEATRLARFFLPQIFFYGATALGSALLNARRRFTAAAWAPILNNVVVIGVLLAFEPLFGPLAEGARLATAEVRWLGIGTTLGIVATAMALVPSLGRAGVVLRWRPQFGHPAIVRLVRLSGWTVGYVVANQLALVVVYALALRGEAGDLSAYVFAFTFFQLPHGLLAVTLMTTFSPDLARLARAGRLDRFQRRLGFGLQLLALLVLPAAAGYVVLAGPLLDLFGPRAVDPALTADALAWFSVGLFGFSAYLFVLRGFYAFQDTRTPFLLNAFENGVNVLLAVVLLGRYGVPGLAASYALAYLLAAVVAAWVLRRRVGGLGGRPLASALVRFAAAAVVMAAVVRAVVAPIRSSPVAVVVGVVVGAAAYGAATLGVGWVRLRIAAPRRRPPPRHLAGSAGSSRRSGG